MSRSTFRAAPCLVTVGAITLSLSMPPLHAIAAQPFRTDQQIAAMPPAEQAALLNPLRELAAALDAHGKDGGAAIYSGVVIDAGHNQGATSHQARGVQGYQVNGQWGVCGGDSGGLVFAIAEPSTRQVRGVVSSGDPNVQRGPMIIWTEALDIYRNWGLTLNE